MIMCANGVPEDLMIEIFHNAVTDIKGLRGRVKAGRPSKEDCNLMSLCSDVSRNMRFVLILSSRYCP